MTGCSKPVRLPAWRAASTAAPSCAANFSPRAARVARKKMNRIRGAPRPGRRSTPCWIGSNRNVICRNSASSSLGSGCVPSALACGASAKNWHDTAWPCRRSLKLHCCKARSNVRARSGRASSLTRRAQPRLHPLIRVRRKNRRVFSPGAAFRAMWFDACCATNMPWAQGPRWKQPPTKKRLATRVLHCRADASLGRQMPLTAR